MRGQQHLLVAQEIMVNILVQTATESQGVAAIRPPRTMTSAIGVSLSGHCHSSVQVHGGTNYNDTNIPCHPLDCPKPKSLKIEDTLLPGTGSVNWHRHFEEQFRKL